MKTVVVKKVLVDEGKGTEHYKYELTDEVLCDDIGDSRPDFTEIHSTDNNLKLTVFYHEEGDYFYCFLENDKVD